MSDTLDKRRSDARKAAARDAAIETSVRPNSIGFWVGRNPEVRLTYGATLLLVDALLAAIGKYEVDHLGDIA